MKFVKFLKSYAHFFPRSSKIDSIIIKQFNIALINVNANKKASALFEYFIIVNLY